MPENCKIDLTTEKTSRNGSHTGKKKELWLLHRDKSKKTHTLNITEDTVRTTQHHAKTSLT